MTDLLTDKVVLVTGASSGTGKHAAHLLAREGAALLLTARREEELARVADAIRLGALAALGRVGRPEEVAEAAAWLLSDRASHVTGMTLGVDGGAAPWPH